MPTALSDLDLEAIRISGSVWSVNDDGTPIKEVSVAQDAERTIRGNYALPVDGLKNGRDYQFLVQIFYKACEFNETCREEEEDSSPSDLRTASIDDEDLIPVDINTNFSDCPGLSLTPDSSLADDRNWLLLCNINITTTFDSTELIEVGEDEIVCDVDGHDADGDGMANLTEIDSSVNPFNGDFDGDCYADAADAFPSDPDEWLDTDEDGIGDNGDTDADNDGLTNAEEAAIGTDKLDSDSDDDGYVDGSDNCPSAANDDQLDTDGDETGDACDADDDNDGLTDAEEAAVGSDSKDADTDGDGWNDGYEVNTSGTSPTNSDTDGDGSPDNCVDNPGTEEDDCEGILIDIFPLDPTETADSDEDGIGDNLDNCPTDANGLNEADIPGVGNQTNTDLANAEATGIAGDEDGDACDTDDDNDGLLDTIETPAEAGSDPLNPDTDGDGYHDWFGGAQDASDDPCLLVAIDGLNHADGIDGDGFGAACDCDNTDALINPAIDDSPDASGPGESGVDTNCDGVDGDVDEAIFVSITDPDAADSNNGSLDSPVRTIECGAQLAQAQGKSVYVADGSYAPIQRLSGNDCGVLVDDEDIPVVNPVTFSVPSGVMFYGGYDADFLARDISGTTITSTEVSVLIEAAGTGADTGLDGFTLENSLDFGGSPIAVEVTNATLSLSNCDVLVDNAIHSVGIDALDSSLTLENNVIEVFGGVDSNIGVGISVEGVTGNFTGNSVEVRNFMTSRTAINCTQVGDDPITLTDNTLDVWSGAVDASSDDPSLIYVRDCSGTLHWSADPFDAIGTFSGFEDAGGNSLDGLF